MRIRQIDVADSGAEFFQFADGVVYNHGNAGIERLVEILLRQPDFQTSQIVIKIFSVINCRLFNGG